MAIFFRILFFVGCLGLVLFFALKSDPEVPKAMAPSDVRIFFNSFDALRNQLAFGLLGLAALLVFMSAILVNRGQIAIISLIGVLIPALEIAQLWMPHRHVDFKDVLNGWLGLAVACFLYLTARGLWQLATGSTSKTRLATRRGRH
ncbi:MAG TPA: hypothetical protein VIT23_03100 [Terrimicrobiaceae bacterium]